MAWSDYPLQAIEIPNNHGTTGPYIYIGTGDPLSTADAAIVYHFGTHNSAFMISLTDEKTTHDDGHFQILARSDEGLGNVIALVDLDYAPFFNLINLAFGCQRAGVFTQLYGEKIMVQDLGNGVFINPYADAFGTSAGLTVNVGGVGNPELVVNNTGITLEAPSGDVMVKSDVGTVHLNAASVQVDGSQLIDANSHQYLRGESRSTNVSFSGVTSSTVAVTFTHAFSTTPIVTTNINSGIGATSQWHSRAINITPTGFTLFVFVASGTSTWSNVPVQWTAVEPTP